MLKCLHAPAAARRVFTRQTCKLSSVPQCGHRIALKSRCPPRMHRRITVASSQPDVEAQSKEQTEIDDSVAPEEAQYTALERAKALLEGEDLDKAELAAALSDIDSDINFYRERLAASDAEYQSLEIALKTTKDQFTRLGADFENFRRRTAEEKARISSSVKGDVVLELLPLVDNFELARTQVKAETEGEQKINNSYQGLYKQMVEILKSLGVEPVDTVGSTFDPERHEAIMRQPNDDVPDGTVLMEFRKGFCMGDRLLRPAMVQVSFTDAPSAPASSASAPPASESSKEE